MNRTAGQATWGSLVALAAALACAPAAGAQEPLEPAVPVTTEAQALDALAEAEQSFEAANPEAAHPTDELRDLALALPYLEGAKRERARALLSRPPSSGQDAGGDEQFGAEWSNAETANREAYLSPGGRFLIHWTEVGDALPDLTDSDEPSDGVPDYIELVAARADESELVENTALGWPEPKGDGARGGGLDKTDIYISDICDVGSCIYGYASFDDPSPQCDGPPFRCYAFLVLDNDYADPPFKDLYDDPDVPLSVTMAHEYNHVLQFAIDAFQDFWMFESTAVWMEEQVFPDADDWLFYNRSWVRQPQRPLTKFSFLSYGSAVWNHWLERGAGYGPEVVLDSWLNSRDSDPPDFAAGAYNLGIRDHGGRGFAQEFADFTAATAEWRVDDDDFADEAKLRDVRREGPLRLRSGAKKFELDHTSFRLYNVRSRARTIRLRVRAPEGVRTGIALVGRDGGPLNGEIAGANAKYLRRGGRASVRLVHARRFERITAVIANADARVSGFNPRRGDWDYTRDNETYRVSLGRGGRR